MTQDDLLYAFVYGCSPWRPSWAMCGPPVGPWASIPPPTTAGNTSWTGTAPRFCGHGSGDLPGWRTRPVRWSSNGWSPSPSATPASGQPGSPPSSPDQNGVGFCCRPTGCGGCCAAMGSRPGPDATAWWPAMPPRQSPSGRSHRPSGTWTSTILGSWSSWTASVSGGFRAPRARCGNTPPSTSPAPTPGPPSRSPGATPRPPGPARWPRRSPPTWPPAAGGWSG